MLYYEFKKIFNIKKRITIIALFLVIMFFFTYIFTQVTNYSLYEYRSYFIFYALLTLYIIIYVQVSIISVEETNTMTHILMTSLCGREKLVKAKITFSMIITNFCVIMVLITSLIGYAVAFAMDINIPITESLDLVDTTIYGVNTSGNLLLAMMTGFVLAANFAALFSIYLVAKVKNTYLVYTILFIGYFLGFFSLNPLLGKYIAVMPFANYIVISDTIKTLASIGSFSVTPHSISLVVTFILMCILYKGILSMYKVRK